MDANATPPLIGETTTERPPKTIARWRWWVHLSILTGFPLTAAVLGIVSTKTSAALPKSVRGLLMATAEQLVFFGLFFVIAWFASRATREQLRLRWRGGVMPVVLGVAYSVALRILIMVVAVTAGVFWLLYKAMFEGGQLNDMNSHAFRPQIERLIDLSALTDNPVYLLLMLTLVSFVLAGLREELWRAGMLAGFNALFPGMMNRRGGQIAAVLIVSVLFGLAHTTQGPAGVAVTTLLGVGLGAIMVWHRSVWEAVLAHGFFDATTFVFLYVAGKYFPHQLPGF